MPTYHVALNVPAIYRIEADDEESALDEAVEQFWDESADWTGAASPSPCARSTPMPSGRRLTKTKEKP